MNGRNYTHVIIDEPTHPKGETRRMSISFDGTHLRNENGNIVGTFFYVYTTQVTEEGELIFVPQPGKHFMLYELEEIVEIMHEEGGYEYVDENEDEN